VRPAGGDDAAAAYRALPPKPGEFAMADEPLSWEGDGWEDSASTADRGPSRKP
jgi:hypothetical protein